MIEENIDNNLMLIITEAKLHSIIQQAVNSADHAQKVITPPSNNQPKFLSIADMCEMFGVSRITISTWMKQGRVPFKKISRRVFFVLSEVLEAIPSFDLKSVATFQKSIKARR